MFLHKPICAALIPVQFEQWPNAVGAQKLSYGGHFVAITAANIRAFVGGLPGLAGTLATYSQHGNPVLTANLDACLAGLGAAQGE